MPLQYFGDSSLRRRARYGASGRVGFSGERSRAARQCGVHESREMGGTRLPCRATRQLRGSRLATAEAGGGEARRLLLFIRRIQRAAFGSVAGRSERPAPWRRDLGGLAPLARPRASSRAIRAPRRLDPAGHRAVQARQPGHDTATAVSPRASAKPAAGRCPASCCGSADGGLCVCCAVWRCDLVRKILILAGPQRAVQFRIRIRAGHPDDGHRW